MSSPDTARGAAPEERKLTLIVVPHGHLETRSYVIPYRRLKVLVVCLIMVFLAVGVVLATWFPITAQAARVPALVRELKELEEERARVAELARNLQQVEEQYERVRQMLGADAPGNDETAPLLPPLRSDSVPGDSAQLAGARPELGLRSDSVRVEQPGDSVQLSTGARPELPRARQTGSS